ncbi:MAG: hypothetical protein NVS4B9_12270 [Ktedonobacteraceae bacterium]
MADRINGFICYSHKDKILHEELKKHLQTLNEPAIFWDDQEITPGDYWSEVILANLKAARVILLLVSIDFITSTYIETVELKEAMERSKRGDACVIPVILRPVALEHMPFHDLQSLPSEAKPVEKWGNRDEAFIDVVRGISDALKKLDERRTAPGALIRSDTLHRVVLSLNYREQVRAFRKVRDSKVGAFLIQGEVDYGQDWLLHRLIYITGIENANKPPFRFMLTRRSVGSTLDRLWFNMGRWLDSSNTLKVPGPLVEQVYAEWQRQSIILILDDIDGATEKYVQDVLHQFWEPLMTLVGQGREAPGHYLLLFLIDPVGTVENWNIHWNEQLDKPAVPVRLKIHEFTPRDVDEWIDNEVNDLPATLTSQEILANGRTPQIVLQRIYELCGYEWYEQESAWL